MHGHVPPLHVLAERVLTASDIGSKVLEFGSAVTVDYSGRDLRLVTILKGGLFFLSDLARAVELELRVDFMAVSSYGAGSPGVVRVTKDLDDSIEGADVLVVEDIIDTGLTLNYVLRMLRSRNPATLEVCTLLDKDVRRIVDLPIAYMGFSVPDRFLVGYGLDYRGRYRNLPDVYALDEEVLQ